MDPFLDSEGFRRGHVFREWIGCLGTKNSLKPEDFTHEPIGEIGDSPSQRCPFCPSSQDGREGEIFSFHASTPNGQSVWWVRAISIDTPFLSQKLGRRDDRGVGPVYDLISGKTGLGDIIIETPECCKSYAQFTARQAREVIWAYYWYHYERSKDKDWRYILLYKDYQRGGQIRHAITYGLVTSFIPRSVTMEIVEAKAYYAEKNRCILCDMISFEQQKKIRIICENAYFTAIAPFASRFPFEIWIIPRAHIVSFGDMGEAQLGSMAEVLQSCLRKLRILLDDPSYEYEIHTGPCNESVEDLPYYHLHIKIIPRLVPKRQFWLPRGLFFNPVAPEAAAEYLRGVENSLKVY